MRSILIMLGVLCLAVSFAPSPAYSADTKRERENSGQGEGWRPVEELGGRHMPELGDNLVSRSFMCGQDAEVG